ncbi:AI-2E family transporter [Marinobacter salicampi]|uniref:AI-2E family transporter n=1 Tax=Marinobacter salicampi TaxID=435907 RepID=UPI00140A7DF9|nr:AI-2E family transporter [Marinobacter salicampi]
MSEDSRTEFVRRVFIVFAVAAGIALVWFLGPLLMLIFGGLVFALVIRVAAAPFSRGLKIPERWAALMVVGFIGAGLGLTGYFFGTDLADNLQDLRSEMDKALTDVDQWLANIGLAESLSAMGGAAGDSFSLARVISVANATVGFALDLILVILIAIYVAFNPSIYLKGILALFPPASRSRLHTGLKATDYALQGWLKGQLIAMCAVAVLTGFGLWLLGVPMPFTLGLIAGLLEFVPILGPILAALPGVLLAFTLSPTTAAYAALVYLVVQQIESNVIMPIAQQWAVDLPPALCLVAIVIFSVLFGLPGLLFAAPLTVVIMALVKSLYLQQDPKTATE